MEGGEEWKENHKAWRQKDDAGLLLFVRIENGVRP